MQCKIYCLFLKTLFVRLLYFTDLIINMTVIHSASFAFFISYIVLIFLFSFFTTFFSFACHPMCHPKCLNPSRKNIDFLTKPRNTGAKPCEEHIRETEKTHNNKHVTISMCIMAVPCGIVVY